MHIYIPYTYTCLTCLYITFHHNLKRIFVNCQMNRWDFSWLCSSWYWLGLLGIKGVSKSSFCFCYRPSWGNWSYQWPWHRRNSFEVSFWGYGSDWLESICNLWIRSKAWGDVYIFEKCYTSFVYIFVEFLKL